jgi:hypothetical protein
MHKPTFKAIQTALTSDECLGFCQSCGAEVSGVEPDARGLKCEICGAQEVYGYEELLVRGEYT